MEFGSGSYNQASVFLIHKLGNLSTYPKGQHIAFLYSRSPTPNREAKLDSDIGCEFRPPDTEPKIDHYVMFQ